MYSEYYYWLTRNERERYVVLYSRHEEHEKHQCLDKMIQALGSSQYKSRNGAWLIRINRNQSK